MRDLRERFQALDLLETPYQWPEIERRAARPGWAKAPSWMHGAWVAATAAAGVLVFVGGVVAGRWLLGPRSLFDAAFGGSGILHLPTPADVQVLALAAAGLGGGGALLIGTLALAWRWRKRSRETRGGVMETMEKTIERPEIERVTRSNRWLILAVVVLCAALVALGSWLLVDNLVKSDAEQLLDDSAAAMNAGDVDAFMALHAPDIVLTTVVDGTVTRYEGAEELRAWFNVLYDSWYTETTGELVVNGGYVTHSETVGWDGKPVYEGIHVYRVEDGLIAESFFIGRSAAGS